MRSLSLLLVLCLLAFTSCGPPEPSGPLPMDERMLQIAFDPAEPRVGDSKIKIDVRCGCVIESFNGPEYVFTLTGDGVRLTGAPVYDPADDVYYGTIRFDGPGERRFTLEVRKPNEAFSREGIFVVTVAP